MRFVWVHAGSFLPRVASLFHSFVTTREDIHATRDDVDCYVLVRFQTCRSNHACVEHGRARDLTTRAVLSEIRMHVCSRRRLQRSILSL